MLDPLLKRTLHNMFRLSVLQGTGNTPARTRVNQAQSNPLCPRRIPQILHGREVAVVARGAIGMRGASQTGQTHTRA